MAGRTKVIAISMGDPLGIGPEVIVRSLEGLLRRGGFIPVVFGHFEILRRAARRWARGLELVRVADIGDVPLKGVRCAFVCDCGVTGAERAFRDKKKRGGAQLKWFECAASEVLEGRASALVTAPVDKGIVRAVLPDFSGHTDYLAGLCGCGVTMAFLCGRLVVGLVTTHLPLRGVPSAVTRSGVRRTIGRVYDFCSVLKRGGDVRIAVCGLNPHAGSGEFGDEDGRVIKPAVSACRADGMNVEGPIAADAVFMRARRGEFDAVVAMYHDQGMIPVKFGWFDSAVNITLGLPFIRTSPAHGTAVDIAGRGEADIGSMKKAIEVAVRFAGRRE